MARSIEIRTTLFIAVVAAASLACSLLSSVPPVPGVSNPAPTTERPLIQDDFSDSDSGWGTGTDSDSGVKYEDGVLRMTAFREYHFTWSNPDDQDYKDVHLEVTVNNESGGQRLGFGVLCNQQFIDSSFNYFAVTTDGKYAIARAQVGSKDKFLTNNAEWAASEVIPAGASTYRIGADCGHGVLTLYVNGQKVDSVTDTTYTEGRVGLFLWSGEKPSGAISYDDFVVTSLK